MVCRIEVVGMTAWGEWDERWVGVGFGMKGQMGGGGSERRRRGGVGRD